MKRRRRRRDERRLRHETHELGDAPADDPQLMRMIARAVNKLVNGRPLQSDADRYGFVVMVFPFDGIDGRSNYVSNAYRSDVIALMREQVRRFEQDQEGQ